MSACVVLSGIMTCIDYLRVYTVSLCCVITVDVAVSNCSVLYYYINSVVMLLAGIFLMIRQLSAFKEDISNYQVHIGQTGRGSRQSSMCYVLWHICGYGLNVCL